MDKLRSFLQTLKTDPRAAELVRNLPIPQNDQQAVECYADLAKELGCELSREEIVAGFRAMIRNQKKRTATAEKELEKTALGEDVLDMVAGGAGHGKTCESTYTPGEWCWWTDQCNDLVDVY